MSFESELGFKKFVAVSIMGLLLISSSLFAESKLPSSNVDQLANKLIVKFIEAVIAGPDELAPMLAPEYQIMRSNGVGYNREEYLTKGLGKLSIKPVFAHKDIVVTLAENTMVVRYILEVDETIDGRAVSKRAPRLTVFRLIDNKWKVVAHSNFAKHNG